MASARIVWEELIFDLYNHGFILFGEFTLSSGLKSPYYIDLRLAFSVPHILRKVAFLYRHEAFRCCRFDAVAGIEMGSIPIAGILAYTMDVPMVYVRKSAKEYATKKYIEGIVNKGDRILVLEDVSTTGSSVIHAVERLREVGAVVDKAIVFIDRGQGATESLKEIGVDLIAIYRVSDIMDLLYSRGYLDGEKYNIVMEYLSRQR